MGLEPTTLGTTIRCSNQLSYTHHIKTTAGTSPRRVALARLKGLEPLTHCLEDVYKRQLLSRAEGGESISQFNHPGSTFGTFSDFAYWDPVIDERMFLVEVGNGEGAIGSGGYFPSYEYYTMALDKGW